MENLAAAGLAGMIFVSAYEMLRQALFASPAPVQVTAWMLALLVATVAIPLIFSHFELRAARAANSPALMADAREYRVHVFTTGLAFLALLSQWLRFPLDRVAALLIVVVVIKTGCELLRDAMRVLLDASLDAETLLTIRETVVEDPAVTEVKWTMGRNAGRFRFVEIGVALRVAELEKAEAVVRRIETAVRAAVPHVERVLLHVEAPTSPYTRYAVPLADRVGRISDHFGEAPWFAVVEVRRVDGGMGESRILANPHRSEERAKGMRVAEWLVTQKADVVLTREELKGKGPAYVLRDAGIDLRVSDRRTLTEVLDEQIRQETER